MKPLGSIEGGGNNWAVCKNCAEKHSYHAVVLLTAEVRKDTTLLG